MIKHYEHYCDICQKPLGDEPYGRYKVKNLGIKIDENGLEYMMLDENSLKDMMFEAHDRCWQELCKEISELRSEKMSVMF